MRSEITQRGFTRGTMRRAVDLTEAGSRELAATARCGEDCENSSNMSRSAVRKQGFSTASLADAERVSALVVDLVEEFINFISGYVVVANGTTEALSEN